MRVKTAKRLCSQPTCPSCQAPLSHDFMLKLSPFYQAAISDRTDTNSHMLTRISVSQTGASTWLLALFVAAILVTAIVGSVFGHKLGYQSGYHSIKAETDKAAVNGKQTSQELEDLRVTQKVLANQVATAKQELEISLANLDELRRTQRELNIENAQVTQLNDLYSDVIADNGGMPLQVLGAKIEPLPENAFEYGFDIGMLSAEGTAKSVLVSLTLLNDDDFVEVPLEPTRYSVKGIERIRGRFVMPERFKPLQAKLTLKSGNQEAVQLYDWDLGAMVDDMPLSLMDLQELDESPIESE